MEVQVNKNLSHTGRTPPVSGRDGGKRWVQTERVVTRVTAVTQQQLLVNISATTLFTLDLLYREGLGGDTRKRDI